MDGKTSKTKTKFSKLSVTWKKNENVAREPIDIRSRKYSSSHSRQQCKDVGKYPASLSGDSDGKICKTLSIWSSLLHQEGTLYCCIYKHFKKNIDERILMLKNKIFQIVENIKIFKNTI